MEPWLVNLFLLLFMGVVGSALRILMQRYSYKEWPHDKLEGYLVALALGLFGGYFAWEFPNIPVISTIYPEFVPGRFGALVLGYFFPDIGENLMEGFKPKPSG